VSSMEDSIVLEGFATMIEEEANQEDRRVRFSSIIEGVTNETDWKIGFSLVAEDATSLED
jgi:hypothetical protein